MSNPFDYLTLKELRLMIKTCDRELVEAVWELGTIKKYIEAVTKERREYEKEIKRRSKKK